MGRAPCCDKANVKKGPWSPEEDAKLKEYIDKNGTGGNWIALPHKVGLRRCGKSCRLRWLNYLRPNIKHGQFSDDEDRIICTLFATIGSRWSIIAAQLPGRTDNDIKNYWNTKLKKKLFNNMANHHNNNTNNLHHHHHQPQILHHYSSMAPSPPLHAQIPPLCENLTLTTATAAAISCGFATPAYNHEAVFAGEEDRKNHNALMFGGDQASCSSSEISHSDQNIQSLCFQEYFANSFFTSNDGSSSPSPPSAAADYGCFGDNLQDYYPSIEEIKELITGNGDVNYNGNLDFFVDEIKTEEKVWCNDHKVFKV